MNLNRLQVSAHWARLINLAQLPNYMSISANVHTALKKLFATCFETGNLGIYTPSTIYFLVVQNIIVSAVSITPHGPYAGYMIYNACTEPAFRKQGLMSMLIQQILADFAGQPVYLQVKSYNHSAYNLYLKLGFSPVNITGEIITMQY